MNYGGVQRHIDIGLGKAALRLGQPFSVYRADASATGDFPGGWSTIATRFPMYRERRAHTKIESAIANAALFYDIFGDMTRFLLGDVFLCTDPAYNPGVSYGAGATILDDTADINAVALAWHMPAYIPTGVRIDHLVRVYRPASGPLTQTDGSKYWESTQDNDRPLVLTDGVFAFGTAGSGLGSIVPGGLSGAYRPSGAMPFGPPPPGMLRPSHWYVYLPPLPGYEPLEGDAIVTSTDDRYVVVDPFNQESGVVGSQLMCDRMIGHAG